MMIENLQIGMKTCKSYDDFLIFFDVLSNQPSPLFQWAGDPLFGLSPALSRVGHRSCNCSVLPDRNAGSINIQTDAKKLTHCLHIWADVSMSDSFRMEPNI